MIRSILALVFIVPLAQAAELRPVTHEEVWLMARLGTPEVSPDGRHAVVSVTRPSYEEDGTITDLWLVAVDGDSEPRRLTSTREGESAVDFSPDGRFIAFSAKRGDDEANQIYRLPLDGPGEAVRLTDWVTGASRPRWSPDGTKLMFESRVYRGAADNDANAAEKKAREERGYNVSAYEMFPVRQWDRWRDDLQTHLFVMAAEADATPRDLLHGSELVGLTGFAGLPSLGGESLVATWSPDGRSLIFTATTNLDQAAYTPTRYQLYQVDVDGGEPARITHSETFDCHSAQFSHDGESLYCSVEPHSDQLYELSEVGRGDWKDGTLDGPIEILTESFDRSVDEFTISADDRTLYLTANDAGRARLYRLSARGGEVKVLDADSSGVYAGARAAGKNLIARWESSADPAELVRIDPRSGRHVALTAFNTERREGLDRPAFREFWFESSKGRRIHNWLALPPGFDESKQYPLVLFIHGGPFSSSRDTDHVRWSPHLLATPGYVVLLTDYTGSVGYGEAFSQAIMGDPLRTPGEELIEAADVAIERFGFIDGSRQAAAGASYGGHLVNWLQATTTRFKALVGHAGLVDLEGQYSSSDTIIHREIMNGGPAWEDNTIWRDQSPSTYADQFATPILLTIGEKDYRVPVNQTIAAWSYVQRMQVPGRLLVFHDANHWIMKGAEARYFWNEVHAWLARHL